MVLFLSLLSLASIEAWRVSLRHADHASQRLSYCMYSHSLCPTLSERSLSSCAEIGLILQASLYAWSWQVFEMLIGLGGTHCL